MKAASSAACSISSLTVRGFFKSIGAASQPASFNPATTALPDFNEIALSLDQPPMSTPTRPDNFEFQFKLDPIFLLYFMLSQMNKCQNIPRRSVRTVNNKIGMTFGD